MHAVFSIRFYCSVCMYKVLVLANFSIYCYHLRPHLLGR